MISEMTKREADARVVEWFEGAGADDLWITSTTISELLVGIAQMPDGKRRDTLRDHYSRMFAAFEERTLSFESRSAVIFGDLVAAYTSRGKAISREDAQIASSCIASGATLATRNVKEFSDTPGLKVINPWREG